MKPAFNNHKPANRSVKSAGAGKKKNSQKKPYIKISPADRLTASSEYEEKLIDLSDYFLKQGKVVFRERDAYQKLMKDIAKKLAELEASAETEKQKSFLAVLKGRKQLLELLVK